MLKCALLKEKKQQNALNLFAYIKMKNKPAQCVTSHSSTALACFDPCTVMFISGMVALISACRSLLTCRWTY